MNRPGTRMKKYKIMLTVVVSAFFMCFVQCSSLQRTPARTSLPVQVIPKQFPDGSAYFILFGIPDYFPSDIPVYPGAQVQKVFVYHERDMDLIFKTTDAIEDIVQFFTQESKKQEWIIERITPDPKAEHQVISLPLSFKDQHVETFQYFATRGRIFAAKRGSRVMVCRIFQAADSPYTFIVQQIRTGA